MKQSLFEEFYTLFNLPLYITVTCLQLGIWRGRALTAHRTDLINAWRAEEVLPLSICAKSKARAAISQLEHIVIKICTAGAQWQCLDPESAGLSLVVPECVQ